MRKKITLIVVFIFIFDKPLVFEEKLFTRVSPLAIECNEKLKRQGYRLPSEFRSYLPTCNYWR